MFKANYFLFLVAIVFSALVRGHDEAAKITPTSISNLRGNISRYLYSEGVKEGFIDIEGFDVNSTSIEIQFFEDELTHTFTFIKKIVHHSNGFYWYGREENRGSNLNLLVKDRTQGKRYTGSATIDNKVYNLMTLPNGQIRVQEADVSNFADMEQDFSGDDRKLEVRINEKGIGAQRKLNDIQVIDIMCLYTPEAICNENFQGSDCDIENQEFITVINDKCELAIDETNVAFEESGVFSQLRLVHSGLIGAANFIEERYMCQALGSIKSATDTYAQISSLRDEHGADLVTILTKGITHYDTASDSEFEVCGCGDLFNSNSDYAYSIVSRKCATGYFSVGHEIGHNLGGMLHGTSYKDPENAFRTIMAYNCKEKSCERVQRFSTPHKTFNGKPIGTTNSNNVEMMNQNIMTVANFRNNTSATPTMSLSSSPTGSPTMVPTPLPTAAPTPSPTDSPTGLICNQINNVKIQVEVTTSDNNPQHLSWRLVASRDDTTIMSSENYELRGTNYVSSACVDLVSQGKCLEFNIQSGGALQSYEVKVDDQSVVISDDNFVSKIDTISIDATNEHLHETDYGCEWLRNRRGKIDTKCARDEWKMLCPKTCEAC